MTDTDHDSRRPDPVHETFSQAYQKLIENNGDLVGMVAYALYKNQKKIYVEKLASRYRTISRRSRRIEAFHDDVFDDSQISDLRDAADLRLTTYVKTFVDEARNEIYRQLASPSSLHTASGDRAARSKTISKWIFGVSTSVAAAIILGVLVDLDDYFPSIDPFPDGGNDQAKTSPAFNESIFEIEPAAPPRRLRRPAHIPVM